MRTLRRPNGPRNVPAPKMLERWGVGDIVIREVEGEKPFFRIVRNIDGDTWSPDPSVTLRVPDSGISWRGLLWYSSGQANVLTYQMSEAQERYRLCPEAILEQPF